ncbi:MAG: type I methionyl aminopeptidase [Pirellulaceae bacterium]|nr:type I methionyl aminopeptidase [Pirellulaceae bacterium]
MIRRSPRLQLAEHERELMRSAGRFNAQLMDHLRSYVAAGVSTDSINRIVHDYTLDHGHRPACLGYRGDVCKFPKSCCISVNDVVCHGIPGDEILKEGDIVNIDITTSVDGWHGDQSETFLIGQVSDEAREITQCAFNSLYRGIEAVYPGCQVAVIGEAIVDYVRKKHPQFGVVDRYVGHGIGQRFHQLPNIPHVPSRKAYQDRLYPGMCFTIEPMINGGGIQSVCDSRDGWTVRTADGKWSAQFEHTLLMTENGVEILTLTEMGPQPGHRF